SDIDTPVFDSLAANGLRYRNFHTTALCSPTRACLLTGRNHHSNGMGRIVALATGFPGYDARIPTANRLLPEILVPHGYAAWA
ncbi:sulfatase-like hydrolase/transferase, partial [Acinetobacter baumannii]